MLSYMLSAYIRVAPNDLYSPIVLVMAVNPYSHNILSGQMLLLLLFAPVGLVVASLNMVPSDPYLGIVIAIGSTMSLRIGSDSVVFRVVDANKLCILLGQISWYLPAVYTYRFR